MMLEAPNNKLSRSVKLKHHYAVVGEPGEYYLTHFTPENDKGRTIANELFEHLNNTDLSEKLIIIGTDGTNSMTGKYNGCIRALEELLERPLQWAICLLHCNELPLRHVFLTLDGTASGPDSFTGPIGKKLKGNVSDWPVIKFKRFESPHFPNLPQDVVHDLSTDQYYAYKICKGIISGSVDSNLQYLEVGPINLSRWLTLACRILRYFVSIKNPSQNLKHLSQFCIQFIFQVGLKLNYIIS